MNRAMFVLVVCLSGCGSQLEPDRIGESPIVRSPLEPGVYSGITAGSATISGGGVFESVGPVEGPSGLIVISESGIPIENGRELSDGLVFRENIFGFAVTVTVSLNVTGDALIVNKRITGSGVEGFGQEIYVAISGSRMSYSAEITLSGRENGSVVTFWSTETGIVSL